ncbi:MAG TPA: hypothetical protein VJV05_15240, partial [Pyrinomonadaceae bacterium]|nr:hypothetical protein [Pyrinomonadaceae bacterium]
DEPASTEVKKAEPPPSEVKQDEPVSAEVKKDEPPAVEVKKDEPVSTEVKKDEPTPSEVKKDEPASTEVKKDEPTPSEVKKDEPTELKTDEPAPTEVKKDEPPVAEIKKDESSALPPTETKKVDPLPDKPDKKTAAVNSEAKVTSPPLKVDDARAAAQKPLFEPIIITIPNSRPKQASAENKTRPDEKLSGGEKSKKQDDQETASTGSARQRVIDGQEVKVDNIPPCKLNVSQERISLINAGGNVGLLVGFEGPGDIKTLSAKSSSPKDVEVHLEPEISGIPDRRFFVIKSVTGETGAYQITFTMPCGTKDVLVTVR